MNTKTTLPAAPCGECGMLCDPSEYHPYAACLMFKGCRNSSVVRANLTAVREHGAADRAERAAPAGAVLMPEVPTPDLLDIIMMAEWDADWKRGKAMQAKFGTDAIWPKTEYEEAAGQYQRLREALAASIPSSGAEGSKL